MVPRTFPPPTFPAGGNVRMPSRKGFTSTVPFLLADSSDRVDCHIDVRKRCLLSGSFVVHLGCSATSQELQLNTIQLFLVLPSFQVSEMQTLSKYSFPASCYAYSLLWLNIDDAEKLSQGSYYFRIYWPSLGRFELILSLLQVQISIYSKTVNRKEVAYNFSKTKKYE